MMPHGKPDHDNEPPGKQEALQYITYSAKELLYMLNQKVDDLDQKMDSIALEHARLDARYVSQAQFVAAQKEMTLSRRFAIGAVISSVGAFGTFLGLLLTSLP